MPSAAYRRETGITIAIVQSITEYIAASRVARATLVNQLHKPCCAVVVADS